MGSNKSTLFNEDFIENSPGKEKNVKSKVFNDKNGSNLEDQSNKPSALSNITNYTTNGFLKLFSNNTKKGNAHLKRMSANLISNEENDNKLLIKKKILKSYSIASLKRRKGKKIIKDIPSVKEKYSNHNKIKFKEDIIPTLKVQSEQELEYTTINICEKLFPKDSSNKTPISNESYYESMEILNNLKQNLSFDSNEQQMPNIIEYKTQCLKDHVNEPIIYSEVPFNKITKNSSKEFDQSMGTELITKKYQLISLTNLFNKFTKNFKGSSENQCGNNKKVIFVSPKKLKIPKKAFDPIQEFAELRRNNDESEIYFKIDKFNCDESFI